MRKLPGIIKARRISKGLTQKQFASMVGRSQQLVQKWENGTGMPTSKQLKVVSEVLDIPIGNLIDSDDDQVSENNFEDVDTDQVDKINVRPQRHLTSSLLVEVPFLSVKAQSSPDRIVLNNCQVDTGETHPVLSELIDKRHEHLVVTVPNHSMEPELRQDTRVLCRHVEPNDIPHESGAVYVVMYTGRLVVKRIRTNDIRTNNTLTLHSDNEKFGQIVITPQEIECMWRVLFKIYEPVH
ncbi:MAG: helix-turn-helix domain-containing protein [Pedobacter sp.]|nr:MAG: helix-turn-helix domain-containing protein [Pedobacter sp.]